jgi:Polysaccharide lyase
MQAAHRLLVVTAATVAMVIGTALSPFGFGGSNSSGSSGGFHPNSDACGEDPDRAKRPTAWQHSASFEGGISTNPGGGDGNWREYGPFEITRADEAGATAGSYAVRIETNGGTDGCSCPRFTFQDATTRYGEGDEVWIGGSWRIPDPSAVRNSRLMNLVHFNASGDPTNYQLGLYTENTGGQMRVRMQQAGGGTAESVLSPQIPIPVDRWFTVLIHFDLSRVDGEALTETFVDGVKVASSTNRNMLSSQPLEAAMFGLPYFWPGNGDTTVYFDAPRLTG